MHQAAVGFHCPTCVRNYSKQSRPAARAVQVALQGHRPIVTQIVIAICIGVYLWDVSQGASFTSGMSSQAGVDLSLNALDVKFGDEWYRIVTSAFAHRGLMHIGFNMWLLWQIGQVIEGRFGSLIFASIYATGILGGSLGAMLVAPQSSVVGASGAVFALMGVLVVMQYRSGQSIFASGIGQLLVLNVAISFLPSVSLGGHFGGLAVGLVSGLLLSLASERGGKALALVPIPLAAIGLAALVTIVPVIDRAAATFV